MKPRRSSFASLTLASLAVAAVAAGCATAGTGADDTMEPGTGYDAGGVADARHDGSGGSFHRDGAVPLGDAAGDTSSPPPDMDSAPPPDMDSAPPDMDSAPPPVDAGVDSAPPPPVDAGVDSAPPPPKDAGVDSAPPPVDAGVDSAPPPVDAGIDSGGVVCDPVKQTGCPAGDKCTLNNQTPPPTCDPNGTVGNGQLCTNGGGTDNCSGPGLCVGVGGQPSTCRDFCNTDSDCTQGPVSSGSTSEPNNVGHCIISVGTTSYKVCTFACNPVTKAGSSKCPTGQMCVYGGTTNIPELTDCETPGTVGEGGDCTNANCGAGLVCVTNGSNQNLCRQVCRNGKDSDCSNGLDVCYAPSGVTSPMFGFCCDAFNGC